jgi:hypothetical protein
MTSDELQNTSYLNFSNRVDFIFKLDFSKKNTKHNFIGAVYGGQKL